MLAKSGIHERVQILMSQFNTNVLEYLKYNVFYELVTGELLKHPELWLLGAAVRSSCKMIFRTRGPYFSLFAVE